MSTLFPYTTLFRSRKHVEVPESRTVGLLARLAQGGARGREETKSKMALMAHRLKLGYRHLGEVLAESGRLPDADLRSEEHTSELQSPCNLVCRLLLDTAPTHVYTLSLHDALPISQARRSARIADGGTAGTPGPGRSTWTRGDQVQDGADGPSPQARLPPPRRGAGREWAPAGRRPEIGRAHV